MSVEPNDPKGMGIDPEEMETPEQQEREQQVERYLFQTIESDLGKPREGEAELSLKRSQRITRKVAKECRTQDIEVPLELMQGVDGLLAQVGEKTGVKVSYGVAFNVFQNILAKNPEADLSVGEESKFIKTKFEETFGDQLDSNVLAFFESLYPGDVKQYAAALEKARKFLGCKGAVIEAAITPGNLEEEPEEASVADISQAIAEIMENYSSSELRSVPISADDVLAIVTQFYDYLPQSWSDCSNNERQVVHQLMSEAVSLRPGAVLLDTELGPTITAE